MNLQEKFWNIIKKPQTDRPAECGKIADEHAIAFTDWCEDYYYPSSTKGIWFDKPDFDNAKQFLTIELLQIYKDKKRL